MEWNGTVKKRRIETSVEEKSGEEERRGEERRE